MNIADRIQKLRKRKGMSQEELADHIGVSRQAVSKWESEQSLPEIDKICLLSDYFGVTTDYLLKGIGPVPEATVSETTIPDTARPEPAVPETAIPRAAISETAIPRATISETTISRAKIPEAAVPEMTIPKAAIPGTAAKKLDARIFAAAGSMFNAIGLIVSVMIWIEKQNTVSVAVGLSIMAAGCMIFVIGQYIGENKEKAFTSFWAANVWFLSLIPISCCFNLISGIKERHWWCLSPIPQMGNFLNAYAMCWMFYFAVCILVDILIIVKRGLSKKR